MAENPDISKVFLESFLKKLLSELNLKNAINERERIEKIKSKIVVYESRNDFSGQIQKQVEREETEETEIEIPLQEFSMQEVSDQLEEIMPYNKIVSSTKQRLAAEPLNISKRNDLPRVAVEQKPVIRPLVNPVQKPQQTFVQNKPSAQKQFSVKNKENKSIINPSKPVVVQNTPSVKQNLTPSIGISVVNEELTGVPSIDKILQDPEVKTVECPGPNKQVLVYKGGKIQAANLTLTGDEINNVMNNLSKKARIPIGKGFFKAAIKDFLITSVMSEFVGTRFIIQRKPQVPAPQM